MKSEAVIIPEAKDLQRMIVLIDKCKSAANELHKHLIASHWKYIRKWMYNATQSTSNSEQKKLMLQLCEKLI